MTLPKLTWTEMAMTRLPTNAVPYDEELARRVARIMGDHSATAKGLAALQQRRSNGEAVSLWRSKSGVFVGTDLGRAVLAGLPELEGSDGHG